MSPGWYERKHHPKPVTPGAGEKPADTWQERHGQVEDKPPQVPETMKLPKSARKQLGGNNGPKGSK